MNHSIYYREVYALRQKPGSVFLSNEFIENLLESHHTNLADLRIQKESAMFCVEESPSLICEKYGLQATEDAGEMLQAVLDNDPLYQRQKRRIERMETLLRTLTDEEAKLAEMRYFKRLPWSQVAKEFNLSVSAMKKRRREALLNKARKFLLTGK
jgi:DNA-directed RNA polymerase specialized sigma subunit